MKKREDVVNADGWVSLSKMLPDGVTIKDITGNITTEFGEPVFQLFRVVLSNGTPLFVEGEHDLPYLGSSIQLEDTIKAIAEEEEREEARREENED